MSTLRLEEMEALLLLLLCILTGARCQDWGVTFPRGPQTGPIGSCMTIPCSYTYPKKQRVTHVAWSRGKERIVEFTEVSVQGYSSADRVQFLGDLKDNCTLHFSNLALGDGGAYYFEVQTQSQKWRSPQALCLTVAEQHCMVRISLSSTGGAHLSDSFSCSTSKHCASSLYWANTSGMRIPEQSVTSKHNSMLSMRIIWQYRGAVLECRVQGYQDRSILKQSRLPATAVQARACAAHAAVPCRDHCWLPTASSQSPCPAEESFPRCWEISKLLPGEALKEHAQNFWACSDRASGALGDLALPCPEAATEKKDQSPLVKVLVEVDNSVPIREGDSFTLRCVGDNRSPDHLYYWVHNNNSLLWTGGFFVWAEGATSSQGGNYTCIRWASGPGRAHLAVSPTTYVAILATPLVHVVATPGPHCSAGDPLSLTCRLNTSVYAEMGFSWFKDGERLEWVQSELPFLGVQVEDAGEYHCEVHNSLGKSTSLPLTITVVYGSDWYQLSPGLMAGFGAGVLLLLLLSNLGVYCLARRIHPQDELQMSVQGSRKEEPSAPQRDSLYEEIPCTPGDISYSSDEDDSYYNSPSEDYNN